LPLLFAWEPNDQSITIPQFGANTIKYFFKHLFGLLGRRFVIVGGNLQGRSDLPILGVIDVEQMVLWLSSKCMFEWRSIVSLELKYRQAARAVAILNRTESKEEGRHLAAL